MGAAEELEELGLDWVADWLPLEDREEPLVEDPAGEVTEALGGLVAVPEVRGREELPDVEGGGAMLKAPEVAKTSLMLETLTAVRVYPVVSNNLGQIMLAEPSPGLTLLAMAIAFKSEGWLSSTVKIGSLPSPEKVIVPGVAETASVGALMVMAA